MKRYAARDGFYAGRRGRLHFAQETIAVAARMFGALAKKVLFYRKIFLQFVQTRFGGNGCSPE
jgi:hypothetical protein